MWMSRIVCVSEAVQLRVGVRMSESVWVSEGMRMRRKWRVHCG